MTNPRVSLDERFPGESGLHVVVMEDEFVVLYVVLNAVGVEKVQELGVGFGLGPLPRLKVPHLQVPEFGIDVHVVVDGCVALEVVSEVEGGQEDGPGELVVAGDRCRHKLALWRVCVGFLVFLGALFGVLLGGASSVELISLQDGNPWSGRGRFWHLGFCLLERPMRLVRQVGRQLVVLEKEVISMPRVLVPFGVGVRIAVVDLVLPQNDNHD